MIKADEVDGELRLVNTVTGQTFSGSNAFRDAMSYADALRIADYREIGPTKIISSGRITGAEVNADRVMRLNNYLSDPANRAALASIGLEDLSGGSVTGRMILFDTQNKKSAVEGIKRTIETNAPGEVVLTDEGMQLFSLSKAVTAGGEAISLSRAQQESLKQLSRINIFKQDSVAEFFGFVGQALSTSSTPEDVSEALKKIGSKVGKMTKRYQSTFSAREVSSGKTIIDTLISEGTIAATSGEYALKYDYVEAMLKVAAGGYDLLSDEEKVLISRSIQSADSIDIGLSLGLPTADLSESIFIPKESSSAATAALEVIQEQLQLRVSDPSVPGGTYIPTGYLEDVNDIKSLIEEALHEQQTRIAAGGAPERMIDIIEELSESSPDEIKSLVGKLKASMQTAVDGHYLLVQRAQKRILEIKKDNLRNLRLSSSIDDTKLREINQLENEIESLEAAIESGDRNPTRVGIPGEGVLKGEGSVVDSQRFLLAASDSDFETLEEIHTNYSKMISSGVSLTDEEEAAFEYSEMMLRLRASFDKRLAIFDVSAVKTDIITEDPFIAQNIAKSKSGGVFIEDMLLLNDPEFLMSPERLKRMQAMVDAEKRSAREFMETGEVPRQILDSLRKSTIEDLSSLSPSARALAMINRRQAMEIVQALRSGVDPRNIPALVNMISNYHISQAFSREDDVIAARIPDAFRYKLATAGSDKGTLLGVDSGPFSSVMIKSGKSDISLPMVNFAVKGRHAIVADSVASTFKAALGTFDLDDAGLPMLGTYVDHKGRTRIAAVTMRDPKGIQESILMKPQLAHAETLRAMLSDDSDLIERQVKRASPAEIYSLVTKVKDSAEINQLDAQEAVELALEVLRPKEDMTRDIRVVQNQLINLRSRMGEEGDLALETVVRIMREGMYGRNLAEEVSEIAPINQRFLQILAQRGSAAIRGRDVIDAGSGLPLGPFAGLGVEEGAPYSYKYLIELKRKSDSVNPEGMEFVRRSLLDSLGIRPESLPASELGTLFATPGDVAGDALRARLGVSYAQVTAAGEQGFLNYVETITEKKLGDIQNSIGLTMNRMASANFLAPQIQEFESNLKTLATSRLGPALTTSLLSDDATAKYTSGMVPPSDIVDLINQMSGTTKVENLEEIAERIRKRDSLSSLAAARNTIEYKRTFEAYRSIANFVKSDIPLTPETLHTASISPSAIARASLDQQGRVLGMQRALGIALGVASEDLPGFDPLILEHRLGVKDDIYNLRNSVVEEYKKVLSDLRAGGATGVDLASVENEMERLRTADLDTIRRILSLSEKGIKKYGSLSTARKAGAIGLAELEALTPFSSKSTRAELRAVSDSRYAKDTRAFLRTKKIKTLFENIKKLEDDTVTKGKPARAIAAQLAQMKGELGEELSKGISVLEEIHRGSGANVLDIVDTLEAEMTNLFGARTERFLRYSGHEGHEYIMMGLHELAKQRRQLRLSNFDPRARPILSGYYDTFKTMFKANRAALTEVGDIPDDLMEISAQTARKILQYNEDRIKDGSLRLLTPGIASDQHLLDYLRLVSKTNMSTGLNIEEKKTASRLAVELHAERTKRAAERKLEESTLEITRRMGSAVSLDPEEAARISSDISEGASTTVREVFDVAKSPYRRISEMLKDNTSSLRRIVDSRGFKQFAIGTTALVVGSFIYQNRKNKDVTQDTFSGPPLMPGGNPYEKNYPGLQAAKQDFNFNNPTMNGMQYRINTSGSVQDLNRLRGLFGDVIDGPIDATMYNGLPMAGQDPYSDMASRF